MFASCDPETERPAAFAGPFFRPSSEAEEEEFPAHPRDFTSSYMRSDHSTIISHVFQVINHSLRQPCHATTPRSLSLCVCVTCV